MALETPQPDWAPVSVSPTEALIAAEEAVADSIAVPAESSVETLVTDVPIQEIQADIVAPIEQPIEPPDSAERGRKKKTASLLAPPAYSGQTSATKKSNRGKAGGS